MADTPALLPLADGVHAHIQPDGGWYLNNAVLVTGPGTALTVDTAATEDRTLAYRAAIAEITDAPVRTVVATHHHGDHTHGNHLFPGAAVVGTPYCRERVARDDYHAVLALFTGPAWGDIRPAPPTVTFTDRLTLWCGDRRVELRHPGRPAHTGGDVYAWLPDDRILIAGDLLFNGGMPLLAEGSPAGLERTLHELAALDPAVVVPGHGAPGGPALIRDTLDHLTWLQDLARTAHADGLTPAEAARTADRGPWSALREQERLVANLHACYADLTGTPVDLMAMATDLVEANGGTLITSHA